MVLAPHQGYMHCMQQLTRSRKDVCIMSHFSGFGVHGIIPLICVRPRVHCHGPAPGFRPRLEASISSFS